MANVPGGCGLLYEKTSRKVFHYVVRTALGMGHGKPPELSPELPHELSPEKISTQCPRQTPAFFSEMRFFLFGGLTGHTIREVYGELFGGDSFLFEHDMLGSTAHPRLVARTSIFPFHSKNPYMLIPAPPPPTPSLSPNHLPQ